MSEEPIEITPDFINIRKIVAAKNPRLLKVLPGFLFTLLEKIIHRDVINHIIYTHRDKSGLPFVKASLDEFGVSVKVSGNSEDLPLNGRFLIVS
ncbi:MAG TPA: hypothetical protein VLR52_01755, partial [Bacteroidales bacterium]|nr:hypothetical protein [Bacteroidales bacterium]